MSTRAAKYRGATITDLDPPPSLSLTPQTPISHALLTGYERDYTHLTIISDTNRALLGYVSIPRLRELLERGEVREDEAVERAMMRFRRRGRRYVVITPDTALGALEGFFEGEGVGGEEEEGDGGVPEKRDGKSAVDGVVKGTEKEKGEKQDFAVVTDEARKFVLGVVTRADLDEFVRRRPV